MVTPRPGTPWGRPSKIEPGFAEASPEVLLEVEGARDAQVSPEISREFI
jgi:hypothetical protein